MSELQPIPIPIRQRWRAFRTRTLPVLVFVAAVAGMAWLWDQESVPAAIVGEVYAPFGTLNAPRDGWLEGGTITLFREVTAGEEIAIIRTLPPEHAQLALAVLHEEIRMIRLGAADPALDQQRNLLSLQGLRRDWLLARSDLAALRVRKRQAAIDLARVEPLAARGAESQAALDQTRAVLDAMVAEEAEKSQLVAMLESAVKVADAGLPEEGVGVTAALDWKEAELRRLEAELAPVAITAPFDGRLTRVFRHVGDFVNQGEPIVEIRSGRAEGIIGYLKVPYPAQLEVGMVVEVVPRGGNLAVAARASVLGIGPQFEALQPAFVRPLPITLEERALPIHISLPENTVLVPGELVDIRLLRDIR